MAAEKTHEKRSKANKEGKAKQSKKKVEKSSKKEQTTVNNAAEKTDFSLLADHKTIDTVLASLFVNPSIRKPRAQAIVASDEPASGVQAIESTNKPEISDDVEDLSQESEQVQDQAQSKRKRKRKDAADDLEDGYMRKLARQSAAEPEDEQKSKRIAELGVRRSASKQLNGEKSVSDAAPDADEDEAAADEGGNDDEHDDDDDDEEEEEDDDDDELNVPQHESLTAASNEMDKASRTVFVGNVSTTAIKSKSDRKTLERHLTSFIKEDEKASKKLESLRFRSTPFDPSLPKKAAFAKKEVVDATSHSTNAYVVYSDQAVARAAVKHLNATVVLNRHIRVDSVMHPSPIDHKRCVFVGNLGFVDDESNIIAANEAEGREKRKQNQKPSDVEEGLWQLFGKHGSVESVRVVRDKGTRVGKGIAYVQFTDQNGVESALSEDGKKAPPMLPRKLRVSRAKAMKRKKPDFAAKSGKQSTANDGYRRKITPGEATYRGRVGKLMGKAAAALTTKAENFRSPESFVFEGHRASAKQGNTGLKLGKVNKKKALPTKNSTRRAAAFRSGKVSKKTAA